MQTLKSFWLLILLFLSISTLLAQNTGDIRGFVYEKDTGEPMVYTNVVLKGTTYGAATDLNGFFSINQVPAGDYLLTCTLVGFDTATVNIKVVPGRIINEKLYLSESTGLLQEVVVGASKEEAKTEIRISTIKITPKQITKIPAIGGEPDLAQYLQIIPGVVFTGDQGGQLYIRGGSQIQTKVLLDGMTIYNPFHSIGLFSVFETDLIRNVDVITGGFSGLYSGRISAVIDITTRDGNQKSHSGKISTNTFLSKVLLEGPISRLKDDGYGVSSSYVFTAKTSYLNKTSPVLYPYIGELPYSFTDLYGKWTINLLNGSKFSLSGFRYIDDAQFASQAEYGWDQWGTAANFVIVPGQSKIIIDGFFSYSNYALDLIEATDDRPRTTSIGGFNGGVNFSYYLPKGDIKYGIEVSGFNTTFEFYNPLGIKLDANQSTTEIGGYFKYKANLFNNKLLFEPSIRSNFYASLPAFTFEPRLGMKLNLSDNIRLKASGGIYTQNFTSTKSDQDVVNLFTGFLSSPEEQLFDINGEEVLDNLQRAKHAIFGMEANLTRTLEVNAEVYYKQFDQLINVNRNKLFAIDPNYIVEAGSAYGFDILFKHDYKRLYAWAVYSHSYVNRNDGEQIYPPHFDRRHNVNLVSSYKLGKDMSWEVSGRFNWGSAFPVTQEQGFYEQVNFDNGIDVNYLEENGILNTIYADEINGGRLSDYHRFDVSIKKTWTFINDMKLVANGSLTNVYNRKNIFYVNRLTKEEIYQLPIIPSAGLSFEF